jgi:hypothetical protein
MVLNILLLLWLSWQNMTRIFGVFENWKYWHFCVKLVVLRNPFSNLVFMYIQEGLVYNVWGCSFKMVNIHHNTQNWVIPKREVVQELVSECVIHKSTFCHIKPLFALPYYQLWQFFNFFSKP